MRQVIIVGDACSGKSTVLRLLQQKGFRVLFEEGLPVIPPDVEQDKFLSNKWFIDYYRSREEGITVPTILEYALHFQYPFTVAQRRTGKITPGEEVMLISHLAHLTHTKPLTKDTIVFHLTLDNSIILSRLATKKLFKPASHVLYLDALREETQRYFSARATYYKMDTLGKQPEEIAQWIEDILSKENVQLSSSS
ncbi:hypothetical protein HYV86_04330 [Candidatus Woesearchaeota archaeon]|nr:hypothetical protein [Candidatus Woesearchaeota archaeon]